MGHIKMMAATQPFLSGAISKTVNLPHDATVDDIAEAYIESWRQGLKAVAIYRDGSKGSQPLNVSADDKKAEKGARNEAVVAAPVADNTAVLAAAEARLHAQQHEIEVLHDQLKAAIEAATQNADAADAQAPPRAVRHRLPAERASVTHKFGLSGHEGYITVGLYPNGAPGEIFIRMAKEGSTVSGLMDSFATAVSLALQHGVPLRVLCEKFAHTRFEPSGWTGNEQIGYAKSIMDYIFRWLQIRFLSGHQLSLFAGLAPQQAVPVEGHVASPGSRVIPSLSASTEERGVILSGATSGSAVEGTAVDYYTTTPPQQGIAPDPTANLQPATGNFSMEDRGVYHAANAMKSMYDMGDAPSCSTCGAIMTRNGSCYRCMECGSTSGCS
jgi:ribonucleoside-diphosphate reductase alpha chain